MSRRFIRLLRSQLTQLRHRLSWAADIRSLWRLYRPRPGVTTLNIRFNGHVLPLAVRGDTLDASIAEQILREDSEYRIPIDLCPSIIFDVGSNIGATALYFAALYPHARIFCFEPLPENLELLKKNTAAFADRITIIPQGLGRAIGRLPYRRSDDPANFGGGTFHNVRCEDQTVAYLPITTVDEVCRQYHLRHIDLMKIDAEGAEWSVIQGTPPQILAGIQVLIGELHSVDDWAICQHISRTHDLGIQKPVDRPCYPFVALRKAA